MALGVRMTPADGGAAFPSHWRMRETAHVNGGREWFGYKHQCIEEPRLSRFDKYKRADRSVASTWRVDGQDCADKADASQRLSVPPIVTDDEAKMLAVLSDVPMSKADLTAAFPAWKDYYYALSEKGLTWWEAGKVRLTDSGTALVAARVQA